MVGILERFNIIKPIPKKVKPICKALYIIELELKGKVEKKVIESLVLKLCKTATKYYMRNRDYLISISHEKEVNLAMKDLLDKVCQLDETSNPINIPILVNEPDPPHPFDTPIVGKEPIPKTTCTALEANKTTIKGKSSIEIIKINQIPFCYDQPKKKSPEPLDIDLDRPLDSPLDEVNDCSILDVVEAAGPSPKKAKTKEQKHPPTPTPLQINSPMLPKTKRNQMLNNPIESHEVKVKSGLYEKKLEIAVTENKKIQRSTSMEDPNYKIPKKSEKMPKKQVNLQTITL